MILPFQPQFKKPILKGIKKHTIRQDAKNRWHSGRIIHFATGVRTKNYNQFAYWKCTGTQAIEIIHRTDPIFGKGVIVRIDGRSLTALEIHELAVNDGFDNIEQFYNWFNETFTGKIIHWTNKIY